MSMLKAMIDWVFGATWGKAAAAAFTATHVDPDAGRDIAEARARLDRMFSTGD